MSELAITALRFGFLALLWVFIIVALAVLRSDLYGTRILNRRTRTPQRAGVSPAASAAPVAAGVPVHTPAQGIPQPAATPAVRSAAPLSNPPIEVHAKPPTTLVVTEGQLRGASMRLGHAPITIGRALDSTLVLEDDYSSNHHARIFPQGDAWYVEDLGSTNGTFLDDRPVTEPVLVPVGVPIQIGQSVIELRR